MASRIFVRNLPPSLSESEFKTHFSASAPVTDAKFIPHRRIGYVGYKTHDAAAKAVKRFNRSYIRMSKIAVELARGVADPNGLNARNHVQSLGRDEGDRNAERLADAEKPAKRARIDEGDKENSRLKEFLDVMQSSKKSRTWEDGALNNNRNGPKDQVNLSTQGEQSDDEYEAVPKQTRVPPNDVPSESARFVAREEQVETQIVGGVALDSAHSAMDKAQQSNVETVPPTDADWLRSRTSRLLDLQDEDEIDRLAEAKESPSLAKGTSTILDAGGGSEPIDKTVDATEDILPDSGNDSTVIQNQPTLHDTGRLFVRNLSYDTTEDDLQSYFADFGTIEEVHIPLDSRSGSSKGFAYVQYSEVDAASAALQELDGKSFQGRLLHILAAESKRESVLDDFAISKLPHKKQQEIRRKQEAGSAAYRWNALYMNPDAVMSSISDRLGVTKSEILDPTSSDAAVKQAHAEINIIQETKAYFAANGVNVDAFKKLDSVRPKGLSERVILVRNFPYGTTPDDLRELFEAHGSLTKLLMPPAGTIAIVELELPGQARTALSSLAFRKFKDSVLHLGKAPNTIFTSSSELLHTTHSSKKDNKISARELLEKNHESEEAMSSTLFVSNLNFSTGSAELRDLFKNLSGFTSARVKTKNDPKRPGQLLSMGFGFVEFSSKQDAESARRTMDGEMLDGHNLRIKESHRSLDAAEQRRKDDMARKVAGRRTKIIVKNLPFEATKKDVQQLFGPYAKSRSVRVPRKFDSSTRGFAFVDFVTAREAENAMEALAGSHLLGRRLNLEFTADESLDPEEEIEKMSKKVGKQADKVALQRLTGGGRKKFSVNNEGDDDVMD